MERTQDIQQLVRAVSHSDVKAALALTRGFLRNGLSAWDVLDSLEPLSLFAFSHIYEHTRAKRARIPAAVVA